jgi:transcriptional regulator with XRE-family HTH domain
MITQIQTILQKEGISASQLAEKLGVQRSSISHILSERNKPSLDFIQKIIEQFPHISSEWILTNKGSYLKQKSVLQPINLPEKPKPLTLNFEPESTPPITPEKTTLIEPIKENSSVIATKHSLFSEIRKGTIKKTIKVITIYDDNTFDEYTPS